MKISIIVGAGLQGNITGVGRVVKNLLINLLQIDRKNEYLFVEAQHVPQFKELMCSKNCSNLSFNVVDDSSNFLRYTLQKKLDIKRAAEVFCKCVRAENGRLSNKLLLKYYAVRNHLFLPIKLLNEHIDILHGPNHLIPIYTEQKYASILTVFDITPIIFPEFHLRRTVWYFNEIMPYQLRVATKIIVFSQNTKLDLIKYYEVPEDKIAVVYLAADDICICKTPLKTETVEKPYILFVGTLEPRKNISTLVNAYFKVRKKCPEYKLVVVGGKGWYYNEIFNLVKNLNLQKDVIFTGYVENHLLHHFYANAKLFVYPSFYEGFGLPPLEAMMCGTPVITSNTSSLPEVVGDAGIMLSPTDYAGLANAMYRVLTNDSLRDELIKKGLERAKKFSWKTTAEQTLKIYQETFSEFELLAKV